MKQINQLGGNSFVLIYFSSLNLFYRLDYSGLEKYYKNYIDNKGTGKKGHASIKIDELMEIATEVKGKNGMLVDFLTGLY